MDIEGLGDVMAEQLTDLGLVRDLADVYSLDAATLATVPRTGEKSIAKLLEAIEGSKSRGLSRLLTGLGIRFVGAQTAQILAGDFGSMDALAAASVEELQASDGIGPEVAASVALFFAQPANRDVVERLRTAGLDLTAPKRVRVEGTLTGKTFVLTGTLPTLTREQASAMIVAAGGKVASAISSKTDYVVAGEAAGSKLVKAESLGIAILDEESLQALVS
jgi:DNA ligase (NAD+)